MPAAKKSSKTKKSKKSKSSTAIVPGFTRSVGAYPGYGMRPGQELKWFDQGSNGPQNIPLGTLGGFIIPLTTGLTQGAGASQRVGRSITIKYIELKINLSAAWTYPVNANVDVSSVSYRVDLMMDKQTNGVQAVGNDVYDTTLVNVDPTNRFDNLFNQDRFVRLKRWEGDFNAPSFQVIAAAAGNTTVRAYRDLKFTKRCLAKVDYSGALGAIAEIRSNSLFLLFTASGGTVSVPSSASVNTADTRILFADS